MADCNNQCFVPCVPLPVYEPEQDGRGSPDKLIGIVLPEVGGLYQTCDRKRESCAICLQNLEKEGVIRLHPFREKASPPPQR